MTHELHPDSVRLAMPAEALGIVEVQRAWLAGQPRLAAVLDELDAETMAQAWVSAILRPPLATYRVLVALDQKVTSPQVPAVGDQGLDYSSRVLITLIRDGDRWVVDDLDTV